MALPVLGLGLSSNAQLDDSPRVYELLDSHPGAFDYLEYSAPLNIEQARAEASLLPTMELRRSEVPLVYHPVHLNLFGPNLEPKKRLELAGAHAQAVGSPWVSNDVGWWHHEGIPLPGYLYLAPPLSSEGLELAIKHATHVRDSLPVPLLLENPAIMSARGSMHVLEFMQKLSEATGCALLIDVGHLVSYQLLHKLPLDTGLEGVDWSRVAQLHVAGGVVTGNFYADDHPQPIRDETWALLSQVARRCKALKAITYEADGHADAVAWRNLERLRPLAPKPHTVLVSRDDPQPQPREPKNSFSPDSCWKLFHDVHSTAGAELDFRVAVLAQHLDAEVPLSRAAVAPTLAKLKRFMAGAAYERWFKDAMRSLSDAFLQWASMESRRPGLEGADALVSLEMWSRTTFGRARTVEGPIEASFSVDLTEALYAVGSLRSHLRARGTVEPGAWEGLLQCARRAPRRPWAVKLAQVGRRITITPKD